jgi:hypothetical protein
MRKFALSSIIALSLIPSISFAEDASHWEFHPVATLVGGLFGVAIAGPYGLILGAAGGEIWAHRKNESRIVEICEDVMSTDGFGTTYITRKCHTTL